MQVSQHGNDPLRWDRSGVVVEAGTHDSYNVRLDGSGRLSERNRTHLRPVQAHDDDAPHFPLASVPDFLAQGARPRTRAAPPVGREPPPAQHQPAPMPETAPPPPPDPVAENGPATPPAPPPPPRPPSPPATDAAPAPTPPATPPPVPTPPPTAPRRNPPRERRAPARLLEQCAVAYRDGDLELADDIIDCVIGMLRLQ